MSSKIILPQGFRYSGLAAGIKSSGANDLSLFAADPGCTLVAAGVYTQNLVRATSIDWNLRITPSKTVGALVVNSGNANACTGLCGREDNFSMAESVANQLGFQAEQVLVLSTGIIGERLPLAMIQSKIPELAATLANHVDQFKASASGILTTDQGPKTAFAQIHPDEPSRGAIAGICKGAGMIGPRMATMLGIITTDFFLSPSQAQQSLKQAVDMSFNRISVDGHMSTNDAVVLLSSGQAEAGKIDATELEMAEFQQQLTRVCVELAKQIPNDGEGSDHLIEISISGAKSDLDADKIARCIASSNLVKTAVSGCDPNWGRIVSAAGYAGADFSPEVVHLQLNGFNVFEAGAPVQFDALRISESMKNQRNVNIDLSVGDGPGTAQHWTSDLTHEYVRINAEYHT